MVLILTDRLGIHNDALPFADSDMGTYNDPGMECEDELTWMQENLLGYRLFLTEIGVRGYSVGKFAGPGRRVPFQDGAVNVGFRN